MDSYLGNVSDVASQNRYTYANNNPVNNIDPSGHYSVNVNGAMQYYQSTGLNELRDYMTSAALWAGQVNAQNGFNRSVATAQNTSMFRYQSITGISQATANRYIVEGIGKAGQVSMNYGCTIPTLGNQAVAKFANNVNAAKNTANRQISNIKANKKAQYDAYVAYQAWLAQQRRLAEQQRRLAEQRQLAELRVALGQKVALVLAAGNLFNTTANAAYRAALAGVMGGQFTLNTDNSNSAWMNQLIAGVDGNKAYAYLWGAGAQGQYGIASGDASIYAGYAEASYKQKFMLYDENSFNFKFALEGDAQASGLMGTAAGLLGSKEFGLTGVASGDVGTAKANGAMKVGANNNGQFEAYAEGELMASAANGEVSGGVNLFGIQIGGKLEGHAGAIGASGKAGLFEENGRHGFKIGGNLAVLLGLGFEIYISW